MANFFRQNFFILLKYYNCNISSFFSLNREKKWVFGHRARKPLIYKGFLVANFEKKVGRKWAEGHKSGHKIPYYNCNKTRAHFFAHFFSRFDHFFEQTWPQKYYNCNIKRRRRVTSAPSFSLFFPLTDVHSHRRNRPSKSK